MTSETTIHELVTQAFSDAGLTPISVQVRSFPGETIAIVEIASEYEKALSVAQSLDNRIKNGFVTVRQVSHAPSKRSDTKSVKNVHDVRVASLLELMNARSRTSESQPSLRFIKDVDERLNLALSPRHQLIFGRRGVGKTSLLLEAKRLLEHKGALVLWVNMHPLRNLDAGQSFLTIMLRLIDVAMSAYHASPPSRAANTQLILSARATIEQRLYTSSPSLEDASSLVPLIQQAISRFCTESNLQTFIFLDDVHYLAVAQVPYLLDLLHGVTRDNPIWLKVAGIQHQTRWFIPDPPTGLQTGHDATIINLDVTLEHPEKANKFLVDVLRGYVDECGASPMSNVLSSSALERLVLASGGVPRDFLTLCAASIQTARQRSNARTVGVQDVNNAAGIAGQNKLQELEDDAAAMAGRSAVLIDALNKIRKFLLTEQQITFFRVDFRDKETRAAEYRLLQALADLRMLHLINASLSDPNQAGQRAEVYVLDLSQYSGSRLKQKLRVLDFERGHMVLKKTRSSDSPKVGDTVLRLVALLRQGPQFALEQISNARIVATDV